MYFKIGLGMSARGALLRSAKAFVDITAIAAFPLKLLVLFKDLSLLDIVGIGDHVIGPFVQEGVLWIRIGFGGVV